MKKLFSLIMLSLIFLSGVAQSPAFQWAKQIGGISNDRGRSITCDAIGNVYTLGGYNGIVDFDPGVGVYNLSDTVGSYTFLSKLDASGNFMWAKNIAGYGFGVTLDSFGNIYTTGYFAGTLDFNPGVGVYNLTSSGSTDIYITKLD
ncbi:MAG TPA: hypothetical protein VJI69_08955, partial [Bacteroidia bacterium]|nr:hypothetical protein [Bacteroidia bacterium]